MIKVKAEGVCYKAEQVSLASYEEYAGVQYKYVAENLSQSSCWRRLRMVNSNTLIGILQNLES